MSMKCQRNDMNSGVAYIIVYGLCIVVNIVVWRTLSQRCPTSHTNFVFKTPTRYNISMPYTQHKITIDPGRFRFLIRDRGICGGHGAIDLLVVVQTAARNRENRDAIRETFGNLTHLKKHNAVIVYFVGIVKDKEIMADIRRESILHGDIVQANYIDSRRNLTLKAVSWMKWISRFCSHAQNVVELDDDVYMNVPRVSHWLKVEMPKVFRNTPYFAACIVYDYMAPTRRLSSRYYLGVSEYTFEKFSPFCDGAGFMLNRASMLAMLKAASGSEYLWIEDLYQTQVLGQKIGLYMHDISRLVYPGRDRHIAFTRHDVVERYLFIYHRSSDQIRDIWRTAISLPVTISA